VFWFRAWRVRASPTPPALTRRDEAARSCRCRVVWRWPRNGAVRRAPNEGFVACTSRFSAIFPGNVTRNVCRECDKPRGRRGKSVPGYRHAPTSTIRTTRCNFFPGPIDESRAFDPMLVAGNSQRRCIDRWVVTIDLSRLITRFCSFAMIQRFRRVSTLILRKENIIRPSFTLRK